MPLVGFQQFEHLHSFTVDSAEDAALRSPALSGSEFATDSAGGRPDDMIPSVNFADSAVLPVPGLSDAPSSSADPLLLSSRCRRGRQHLLGQPQLQPSDCSMSRLHRNTYASTGSQRSFPLDPAPLVPTRLHPPSPPLSPTPLRPTKHIVARLPPLLQHRRR